MLKKCVLCEKGELTGKYVSRKGQYKAKGGTGSKISRWTMRRFLPNLQKLRIIIDGKAKQVYICTKCIKKGDFKKA
jgi:large subunit ribosomal protein L28